MRNNCVEREKIFALAQHLCSGREEQEVSAHVEACESCRSVFQSYQRLDSVLDEWAPTGEPSPWFDARLRAAVAAQAARPAPSFWSPSWSRWMAAPALAALLLVATVVVIRNARVADGSGAGSGSHGAMVAAKPNAGSAPQAQAASQELKMYQNLPVLEDYDMLADFDVISELPKGSHKLAD
ncbi:MAG TPA: zf-HC2 domain-containing protein [Terriglobia bacterium]|nr:zf-HC2 domain-containing protein [Terriglobia bacterium]